MKVSICGAGPGGLYLSILLKRGDPGRQVTVYERNPPTASYGWGVVLAGDALAGLREADEETFRALDAALIRWEAIDVHYRGRRLRSVGHAFVAIARSDLLRLLAQRAASLGVDVRYEHPVDEADAATDLAARSDVLVGADGWRSMVRETHARPLGTSLTHHASRYVWYGADVAVPALTFLFQPTDDGLFQAHCYPYDGDMSTFIVECAEPTWRRAGLESRSEAESVAFCQSLFAEQLGGGKLMSNGSAWRRFATIRNRSWHHGNVVLIGDAAHTAHFSIGSGTRLALDDAIALARALTAQPDDLASAFAAYERDRRPVVERFQEVATDSSRYFESVGRYLGLAPEPFAFNLLTRSGRLTHLELERRDPVLVNRVDRTFAEAGGADVGDRLLTPPPLHTPLPVTAASALANRVVLAPVASDDALDGLAGDSLTATLVAAAAMGAGLVVTPPVAPSPEGRVTSGSPGIWSDGQRDAWAGIVEDVHARGSRLALRLTHAGRRGATRPRRLGLDRPLPPAEGWPVPAASPLPYGPASPVPVELGRAGMATLVEAFAAAADRAAEAGVDVLMLDLSDGYLLAGFLSPLANHRTDSHGGGLADRARFPLEVLAAVRAAWGDERPLAARLVADERVPGGLGPADGVELARLLVAGGCHLVDVTAGHATGSERGAPDYRRGFNLDVADRVRNETGARVMTSGHITRLDQVNTILAAGRADACLLDPTAYLL